MGQTLPKTLGHAGSRQPFNESDGYFVDLPVLRLYVL